MPQASVVALAGSVVFASASLAQSNRACESPLPTPSGASVAIVEPTATNRTLSDVLASRVPGVSVMRSSGVAGTGSRIRIRGPSGILTPQQPLLFIDGV